MKRKRFGWRYAILMTCFARFEWFRRWWGGHWEQWFVDSPVIGILWLDFVGCTRDNPALREPLLRGTAVCEDHLPHFNVKGPEG